MSTPGAGKFGLRLDRNRVLTVNLSESGQVAATSIVVKARKRSGMYKDPTKVVLNNDLESEELTDMDNDVDLSFDLDGKKLESIVLKATNNLYVKSITVTYAPSYTIEFANAEADSYFNAEGQALEQVTSGKEYIASIPYSAMSTPGAGKFGLRLDRNRVLTVNLSESGQVAATSIVVKARKRSGMYKDPTKVVLNNDLESEELTDMDNDVDLSFDLDGKKLESIVLKATNNLYVKSITVKEGGAKKPVELSFDAETASAVVGEEFTAPKLTCSVDGLEITYTSSDPAVATVSEDGKVTLVGAGQTSITARFAGDNQYRATQASYKLNVTAVVNSWSEFTALNNKITAKINFPSTVTLQRTATYKHTYVVSNGEPMLLIGDDVPDYSAGDVIPAGWTAIYKSATLKESHASVVKAPEPSSETATFESIEAKNTKDLKMYGLYIIKNVKFENGISPDENNDLYGTYTEVDGRNETPNTSIRFRKLFDFDNMAAGTYDVTFVVDGTGAGLSRKQLHPVKFELVQSSGIESVEENETPAEYYTLEGLRVKNPAKGIYIRRQGEKVTKVLIK